MAILVSGSLAYDHIMNFPDSFKNHILPEQIHILNVCFTVEKLQKSWGGTAGNIAFTLQLLGGEPIIVSALGSDGADYLAHFKRLGLDTSYVLTAPDQLTASAYITTDVDDNQITAFYNGPLHLPRDRDLSALRQRVKLALISPTNKNVMITHLRQAKQLGWTTIFDPGQQLPMFSPTELWQLIGATDVIIGNDYEIKLLEERSGWSTLKMLESAHTLVTTLGDQGSVITTRGGATIEVAPCPPASVDDPTGAGDAYRAGFCVGLERGQPLKTCGQIGSVAASYAIETYGTQAHTFTKKEFAERYEKTYRENVTI